VSARELTLSSHQTHDAGRGYDSSAWEDLDASLIEGPSWWSLARYPESERGQVLVERREARAGESCSVKGGGSLKVKSVSSS
jgi:hypothetical protein